MSTFDRYVRQQAEAESRHLERIVRIRELAAKHGVTISSPVHDEMIVEGPEENVAAFMKELHPELYT